MQSTLDLFKPMNEADYSAIRAERSSLLKKLLVSPKHYKAAVEGRVKETDAMKFGTLVHAMLLEPETLDKHFAVYPDTDANGKKLRRAGKAWDSFEADAAGKTIVREREWHEAKRQADALVNDDRVASLMEHGAAELAAVWEHPSGVLLKARFDWLDVREDKVVIVGLKTAQSCSPHWFGRQAVRLGYLLTWAMYHHAIETLLPGRAIEMVEVVSEKESPWDVAVYRIPELALAAGREQMDRAIERLLECRKENRWPGQSPGIEPLALPVWAFSTPEADSEMTMGGSSEEDSDE